MMMPISGVFIGGLGRDWGTGGLGDWGTGGWGTLDAAYQLMARIGDESTPNIESL